MVDNFNSVLKKFEQDKGHDSLIVIENQGPSKCTRAHSKKGGVLNKMEEMKATAENMHILVDQATNMLKTT